MRLKTEKCVRKDNTGEKQDKEGLLFAAVCYFAKNHAKPIIGGETCKNYFGTGRP
jgi:hypothetical protein